MVKECERTLQWRRLMVLGNVHEELTVFDRIAGRLRSLLVCQQVLTHPQLAPENPKYRLRPQQKLTKPTDSPGKQIGPNDVRPFMRKAKPQPLLVPFG